MALFIISFVDPQLWFRFGEGENHTSVQDFWPVLEDEKLHAGAFQRGSARSKTDF